MNETLRSILVGTIPIDVMTGVAVWLTVSRGARSAGRGTVVLAGLAIGVQGVHFLEEYFTGFYVRYPELLGLSPWPAEFFVGFNVAWIAVWCATLPGVRVGCRAAYFPVWLLAVAGIVNGVAHPLLAVAVGGYFPGLVTSPVIGVLGLLLFVRLGRDTAA